MGEPLSSYSLERRAYPRKPSVAYLEFQDDNGGIVLDASATGLCVQAAYSLEAGSLVTFRFQPSGVRIWGEAQGRIAWTSETGKVAGIEFRDLSSECRRVLNVLLGEQFTNNSISRDDDYPTPSARSSLSVAAPASPEILDIGLSMGRPGTGKKRSSDEAGTFTELGPLAATLGPKLGPIVEPSTKATRVVLFVLCCVLVLGLVFIIFLPAPRKGGSPTRGGVAEGAKVSVPAPVPEPIQPAIPSHREPARLKPASPPSSAPVAKVTAVSPRSSSQQSGSVPLLPSPARSDRPGVVLQVGAMEHSENASRLLASLSKGGFPAFIFHREGDRLYKVLVGPYGDAHSADLVKQKLETQGIESIRTRWSP